MSSLSGYYLGLLYHEPIVIYVTSGYKDFVSGIQLPDSFHNPYAYYLEKKKAQIKMTFKKKEPRLVL